MTADRTMLVTILVLVALVQVSVPVSMIIRRELTLRDGVEYRFRTRPVDPYDAFRGRYVALGFENTSVAVTNAHAFRPGRKVYVGLDADADGFARLAAVSLRPPTTGDYLKTKVRYATGTAVVVELPFDRYYMNEREAPAAEQAYNAAARDGKRDAYALVRVRAGMPVIENLFIDEVPMAAFLATRAAEAK